MNLVEVEVAGPVMTITLCDEDRRNTLSRQLTAELMDAADAADSDPSVRVVVLTNRGSVFCAGADLREQSENQGRIGFDPRQLFGRFRHSPKPYVGRVDGHCIAGGMGLVAALDISVARRSATFGFTEVRVGVAPAMISVVCLPKMRRVDASAAFLLGRRFSAVEAASMGLITTSVTDEDLDSEVDGLVADLLLGAPGAIAAAKQVIVEVPPMPEDAAFQWAEQLSARLFSSDEARQGMSAYLEKRVAPWAAG